MKIAVMFEESDWKALLFCSKLCFKRQTKSLASAAIGTKGRVRWSKDGLVPEVDSMSIMVDNQLAQLIQEKGSLSQGQEKMFTTGLTALSSSLGLIEIG